MEREGQRAWFGRQSVISALLVPEGPLDVIARLTGLLGLFSIWEIYNRFFWMRSEYRVQSWWLSDWCLDLPCNESLCTLIACLSGVASLAMLAGYKRKVAPLVVALGMAYLSSLDLNIAFPHSYMLTIWLCVALLFRRSPRSIARRLIQFSMIACYGFSGLQKLLTPEFISGHSMAAIVNRFALQAWLVPILKSAAISAEMWAVMAVMVVVLELSLAVGLCFKRTRVAALCGILLFQSAIFATMTSYIALLHFAIFICCLSFFDRIPVGRLFSGIKQKQKETETHSLVAAEQLPGRGYFGLAALATCCFVAFPLRMYLIPHAFERFSTMDRRPWTFCMYIGFEGRFKTTIAIRNAEGQWESINPRGRMQFLSGDSEMLALAHCIERTAPAFKELRIESQYETNGIHLDRKVLVAKCTEPGRFAHKIVWSRQEISH